MKTSSELHVNISRGNRKMGMIPSVSLPAIVTCRKDCSCCKICYAKKLERIYKNVREAYARNLRILVNDPGKYWREVKEAVAKNRFFRFHVSGDIPNYEYFCRMVETAAENPNCQILAFTKRFDFVNRFVKFNGWYPENLHIIFSAWDDIEMDNPYGIPEAHVRFKNGETTAKSCAVECYGNCTECSVAGCGCWTLKKGEQVVFNQH